MLKASAKPVYSIYFDFITRPRGEITRGGGEGCFNPRNLPRFPADDRFSAKNITANKRCRIFKLGLRIMRRVRICGGRPSTAWGEVEKRNSLSVSRKSVSVMHIRASSLTLSNWRPLKTNLHFGPNVYPLAHCTSHTHIWPTYTGTYLECAKYL